jgi:hypothetical protein
MDDFRQRVQEQGRRAGEVAEPPSAEEAPPTAVKKPSSPLSEDEATSLEQFLRMESLSFSDDPLPQPVCPTGGGASGVTSPLQSPPLSPALAASAGEPQKSPRRLSKGFSVGKFFGKRPSKGDASSNPTSPQMGPTPIDLSDSLQGLVRQSG